MTGAPAWLDFARRIAAIAGTGLHYTDAQYDRERYEQLREIAAEMMALGSGLSPGQILDFLGNQTGYHTPRLDVRGAIFRGDEILLVQEAQDGKWAMPGGFLDVGLTGAQAIEKEVREESGLIVKASRLVGYIDRDKRGDIPPYVFHIHKLFFLCEELGGTLTPSYETLDARFWPLNGLPDLSGGRTLDWQIEAIVARRDDPNLPPFFD
jgi:ADP-ribose pyrophosphatase YjhB (NUDIX family)